MKIEASEDCTMNLFNEDDSQDELTAERLNEFIVRQTDKILEARKFLLKEIKEADDTKKDETTAIANFLSETPVEKLCALTLFKNKFKKETYIMSDDNVHEKAIFEFGRSAAMKDIIAEFRTKYPNWKEHRKALKPKIEKNNNQTTSEIAGCEDSPSKNQANKKAVLNEKKSEGEGKISKSKTRKRRRINIALNGSTNGESNEIRSPAKKRKIEVADGVEDSILKESNGLENGSKTKKKKRSAKKKLKAHEKSTNGISEVNIDSNQENQSGSPKVQRDRNGRGRGGIREKGSRGRDWNKEFKNKRNGFINGMSANDTIVSPGGKTETLDSCSPKKEEEGKPSLLRPDWLTNPQPIPPRMPMMREESFGKKENRFGNGKRENRFGRGKRENRFGSGKREKRFGSGKKNFRDKKGRGGRGDESENANMISVPSDWKEKIEAKVSEESNKPNTGSSLLKPTYLTNPEEYKPTPLFNDSWDTGRGSGGSRGGGRKGGGGFRRNGGGGRRGRGGRKR